MTEFSIEHLTALYTAHQQMRHALLIINERVRDHPKLDAARMGLLVSLKVVDAALDEEREVANALAQSREAYDKILTVLKGEKVRA
jgi:ferritin-like metal-binding protein YciE